MAAVTVGWALAQDPYLLPGELTLEEARRERHRARRARDRASASASLILVPSLLYLYRLVLRGTLDQAYEPLDQRFRAGPVTRALAASAARRSLLLFLFEEWYTRLAGVLLLFAFDRPRRLRDRDAGGATDDDPPD